MNNPATHGNKRVVLGTFVFSGDPAITEIAGHAGFDFVITDTEHAPLGIADLLAHGRAASAAGLGWWVRVTGFDGAEVGRLLDSGATGIVFPHFGMDSQASERAVASVRYPPLGTRPTCTGTRAVLYGLTSFSEYVARADRDILSIGLIEDAAAVERVEELLATSSVDVVMPGGGGDLATSLGFHGQPRHPVVLAAIARIVRAGKAAGKKVAIYVSVADSIDELMALEPDFAVYAIDYKIIAAAFAEAARRFRRNTA